MALGNNLIKQGERKKAVSGDVAEKSFSSPEEGRSGTTPDFQVEDPSVDEAEEMEEGRSEDMMLVVFNVENEEYALTIDMVSEVVKTPPIAPIPQVPDYIRGVANVRGNVVTILDLELRMGLSNNYEKVPNHLMVIRSETYHIAVGINQVPNTLTVKKSEVDNSSELMLHSALDEAYIKGIVKKDQRMIILIDILEMMSSETFAE